ncbi:MAG: hypothetical protein BKP49_00880 [Treponema sp. CETP13]|nr:MAG: hypothetical protein BKP49_00880 [Treponema sp. CETP13]
MKEIIENPTDSLSQKTYKILVEQDDLIKEIIVIQKKIHASVTDKKWKSMEELLNTLNKYTEQFKMLENKRIELCTKIYPEDPRDMYKVAEKMPPIFRKPFIETFQDLRQKLTISKIENKAINDYIRITRSFLQGVMEKVIPQRKNKVYSRTGDIVKNEPDSVVLNTYM